MARIHVGGESVEFDMNHLPLHEAIALQKATGWRMQQLGVAMKEGDALAIAALAWLALNRMGKDISFADIESGAYPIDLASISVDVEEEQDPSLNGEAKTSPANV